MSSPAICQPMLRVNSGASPHGPGSVSASCLGPDLVAVLANSTRLSDLLKSVFRVIVAEVPSPEGDGLPDVSGRYILYDDEVRFIPTFPFDSDVKYRVTFDPRPLGVVVTGEPLMLEFLVPSDQKAPAPTEVTHIFPSSDLLPENLLRFYVCFSNSMQRGRALDEISLLDFEGKPVADALYRPPVELWDRTMRRLTVLLDPGRLKRWVGPNVELGPPLKAGQTYTLEIGSGMIDLHGRQLGERFRKRFLVADPAREHISVKSWELLPPVTGSRQALVLLFKNPLDWALLFQTITVGSAEGDAIAGQVAVDQCEKRWSFTPASPWVAGVYHIWVGSSLEDICGNSITGAFDRPIRNAPNPATRTDDSSLVFQLTGRSAERQSMCAGTPGPSSPCAPTNQAHPTATVSDSNHAASGIAIDRQN
jgi:hypothetical protein